MKKSKHTVFVESLANVYNKLYNSEHLYEDDGWTADSGKPLPGGPRDPKAYQEMKLISLIACLEEWLDTFGKDTTVKFNPKGVNLLDAIDVIEDR